MFRNKYVCFIHIWEIHTLLLTTMSSDAKLDQINIFLGGGIEDLLKKPKCKLFFESNAEAKKDDKEKKPCIIYLIYDALLICRPRKYSKKFYVKFHLKLDSVHLNVSSSNTYGKESNLVVVTQNKQEYFIWYE